MKNYKLEEVIKMLVDDARLEFDRVSPEPDVKFYAKARLRTTQFRDLLIDGRIHLTDRFVVSPYMVGFEEASKAFNEGRAIKCKYFSKVNQQIMEKVFEPDRIGNMDAKDDLTFYMITEGKWYIHDDKDNWNKDTV